MFGDSTLQPLHLPVAIILEDLLEKPVGDYDTEFPVEVDISMIVICWSFAVSKQLILKVPRWGRKFHATNPID